MRLWEVYSNQKAIYFKGLSTELTWFYSVSQRVTLSYLTILADYHDRFVRFPANEGMISDKDDFFQALNAKESLYDLISSLPENDRAIILFHIDGYSYGEIASKTRYSETNVSTKISRIKKRLNKRRKNERQD